MPANFAEAWLARVRQILTTQDVAPWLDGIPELDTQVIEMGSGEASEMNVIHIPRSVFNPNVLINNSTYPLAVVSYTDDETVVSLDKYQTEATSISDDKVVGATYPVIDAATRPHIKAINAKKFQKSYSCHCTSFKRGGNSSYCCNRCSSYCRRTSFINL